MKNFIFTKVDKFKLEDVKVQVEEIRAAFDQYLDSYPTKTARTKHGIMGPVGKILQDVRRGKWDAEALTGYALNIHLSNPKAKGISDSARMALEEAISKLLELIKTVPVTAQDKLLELVDYGLYYRRRKKGLLWLESVKQEWISFLRGKYRTGQILAEAWGEKLQKIGDDFERITYPSKKSFVQAKGQKRVDMEQFIKESELKGYQFDEEE